MYMNGGTPPVTLAVIEPGTAQVFTFKSTTRGGGAVRVAEAEPVTPFAAVTVTVYVPTGRKVMGLVVIPLLHK
jgi:hypothetical protein